MPKIICIDGNIGCGKSTLVQKLAKSYLAFEEPVKKWSILKDFYENQEDYAFPFQLQILFSYHDIYKKIWNINDVVVIERSPYSSKNIFLKLLSSKYPNSFTENKLEVYNEIYEKLKFKIDYFIYIKIEEPTELMTRIKNRNRLEEANIPYDYISELNGVYNSVYSTPETESNVITFDGTKTQAELYSDVKRFIDFIR